MYVCNQMKQSRNQYDKLLHMTSNIVQACERSITKPPLSRLRRIMNRPPDIYIIKIVFGIMHYKKE